MNELYNPDDVSMIYNVYQIAKEKKDKTSDNVQLYPCR